ncbi:hypothetical protein OS493_032485, partial [Desmophyllum pertusum]
CCYAKLMKYNYARYQERLQTSHLQADPTSNSFLLLIIPHVHLNALFYKLIIQVVDFKLKDQLIIATAMEQFSQFRDLKCTTTIITVFQVCNNYDYWDYSEESSLHYQEH